MEGVTDILDTSYSSKLKGLEYDIATCTTYLYIYLCIYIYLYVYNKYIYIFQLNSFICKYGQLSPTIFTAMAVLACSSTGPSEDKGVMTEARERCGILGVWGIGFHLPGNEQ